MNPPFSASPNISNRNSEATARHVNAALQRLVPGGRLVTLTANWFSPQNPDWQQAFTKIQETAQVVLSVGVNGKVYSKHGTQMDTRITVIDKVPADSSDIPCIHQTLELGEILHLIEQLPQRSLWHHSTGTALVPLKKGEIELFLAPLFKGLGGSSLIRTVLSPHLTFNFYSG